MDFLFAILVGALVAGAVYLLLDRNLIRILFGLALLAGAANLTVFAGGRVIGLSPPVIAPGAVAASETAANALPQALVLTAIVIGMGLMIFFLTLAWRVFAAFRTLDTDALGAAETGTRPSPGTKGGNA